MQQIKKRPSFAKIQEFGAAIKKIETDYFKEGTTQEIAKTGDWRLWHKAIILPALFLTVFIILLSLEYQTWVGISLCVLLGALAAAIGFNVGHDANHGSFSKNPKKDHSKNERRLRDSVVNTAAKHSFNGLGVTSSFWIDKHNIFHHTYTNINGVDDDVAPNGMLRLHDEQPWKPIHRFQPIYCWFMYGLLYIGWVLKSDFDKYFKGHIGGFKIKITKEDRKVFWATKIFHVVVFWVLPISLVGFWPWVVGYVVYCFSTGLITAIVFQMAHIVEKVSQPAVEIATKEEWIAHEVATTANFSMNNKVLSWLVGGLNFQIEHHLFPKVSHIHYKPLSEKVRKTCEEFDVDYHFYPTFWSVLKSHYRKMVQLSKKPTIVS